MNLKDAAVRLDEEKIYNIRRALSEACYWGRAIERNQRKPSDQRWVDNFSNGKRPSKISRGSRSPWNFDDCRSMGGRTLSGVFGFRRCRLSAALATNDRFAVVAAICSQAGRCCDARSPAERGRPLPCGNADPRIEGHCTDPETRIDRLRGAPREEAGKQGKVLTAG